MDHLQTCFGGIDLQFAECLSKELDKVKENKAAFVEEFSSADYDEVRMVT